ncbi:tetratricopeptide repeat protein [Brucepastera parasyntrophica]|uniref:tetratricopeptide repeat protein n=1 Tax=Brucepastera parasyntrophica TaxID=2880008 RepID=UPI002108907B|nr:tetratricopeptide repeat protein [Brucepastera parasyntrophica]ULQ59784.1 tetratricopeptide repeat protein [Brucepastera parasyntrophica]
MSDAMKEGIGLYQKAKYKEALVSFLGIPNGESGSNLELAYFIGLCYARLERYDDALVYLEQVVTADSDLARVYQCRMVLSVMYTITGRTRLADFELRKLLEAGYESPQVFSALGYIAYEHSNTDQALEWYEKALDLDAENPTALNGYGYILADTGRDLKKALTMCKKALETDPANPAYLDSLGWTYHKLGLTIEAKTYTRRALEKVPNNDIIKNHFEVIAK